MVIKLVTSNNKHITQIRTESNPFKLADLVDVNGVKYKLVSERKFISNVEIKIEYECIDLENWE